MTTRLTETQQKWFAIGVLLLVLIGNVYATYSVFTKPYPGHNDFLTPWEASRSFWLDGMNPYSEETADRIQLLIFGREPLPEEDPGYFAYPFYASYLIVPTIYVSYAWASAIWMVFLEACLIASVFLLFDLFKWFPKPGMLIPVILFGMFFYPAARGLLLGQISHFVFLLQIFAFWALARNRDDLAGIALGISTLKPQMGYLLIPFLLLWALKTRRFRFIGAFVITFLVLFLSSFIFYPEWFGEWLHRLSVYQTYTIGSPMWILTQHYLSLGSLGQTIVTAFFYGLMLWAWWTVLVQGKLERFMWVILWTLVITYTVAPRTASPHFVVFIIPILFYCAYWKQHSQRLVNWRIGLLLSAFFFLPWMFFLLTVGGTNNEQEDPAFHVIMPLVMLAIIWVTRRLWWEFGPDFGGGGDQQEMPLSESSPQSNESVA